MTDLATGPSRAARKLWWHNAARTAKASIGSTVLRPAASDGIGAQAPSTATPLT
jgi:hypothetical protein